MLALFDKARKMYPKKFDFKNSTLYIIRNPAENLEAMEKVEIVRFVISPEEWKSKSVKAA